MDLFFKLRYGLGDALLQAFQHDLKERKLDLQIYQEKSHALKIRKIPGDKVLKALKKQPVIKAINSFGKPR